MLQLHATIVMPEARRQLLMKILTDYVNWDLVQQGEMQEFANICRDVGIACPPAPVRPEENIGSCEPGPLILWDKTQQTWHTDVDKVGRYSVSRPTKRAPYRAYLNGKDLRLMPDSDPEVLKRSINRRISEAVRINKETEGLKTP